MTNTNSRPWLIALMILVLLAAVIRARPIVESDLFWHLDQAEAVLEAHAVRYPDHTSFTRPGAEYINHHWLAGLLLHATYSLFGWAGPILFSALCAAASTLLAGLVALRAAKSRPWLAIALTAMVVGATSIRFEPRPHNLALVLLPAALLLADRFAAAEKGTRPGLLLCGVGLFWSQVHSSYLLLPFLLFFALLAHGGRPRRFLLPVGLLFLIFLAPGGIANLDWFVQIATSDATQHIIEMKPLAFSDLFPQQIDFIFWVDLLLVIGLVRSFRNLRLRIDDLARLLLGILLACSAARFLALLALLMLPWVARSDDADPEEPLTKPLLVYLLVLLIPVWSYTRATARFTDRGVGFGLLEHVFPVDTARAITNLGARGRLFNEYGDGGYLAWRLAPEVQITIDGRTPNFFDDLLFFRQRRAVNDPQVFLRLVGEHRINMALVYKHRPLCEYLRQDNGWQAVYLDERRALFLRGSTAQLQAIDPCHPERFRCEVERSGALESDLTHLLNAAPDAPYTTLLAARHALFCRGDLERTITLAAKSNTSEAFLLVAHAHVRGGDLDKALDAADQAARNGGPEALALRGQIHLKNEAPQRAVADLEQAVQALADETPAEVRLAYARALAAVGKVEEARNQATRAGETGAFAADRFLRELDNH